MKLCVIICVISYIHFTTINVSGGYLSHIFQFDKMIPSKAVSTLFYQLQDCHLQIFWPPQEHSFKLALHQLLNYLSGNSFVVSTKQFFTQNKSNTTLRHTTLKGINCLSHIFLEFKRIPAVITEKSMVYTKFLIFFNNVEQNDNKTEELIKSLSSLVTKSHYIQILPILVHMSSVLYTFSYSSYGNVTLKSNKRLKFLNLSTEFQLHTRQRLNMHLQVVDTPLRKDALFRDIVACNYSIFIMPSFKNVRHFSDKCIIIEMAHKLNFSYDNKNGKRLQNVINPIPMEEANFQKQSGNQKLKVVEYGFTFEPWAYLVATEKPNSFDAAISGTFDVLVWLILFVLNMSIRFHQKLLSVLKLKNKNKLYKLARVLWAISMSTIISQAYKGRLTGFLAKPPKPHFPKDFEAIVQQNITTVTFSGKSGPGKGKWQSNVKLYTGNRRRAINYLEKYVDFLNSITESPGWPEGMANFTAQICAQENNFFGSRIKNHWFRYPSNIAVLEPLHHIILQKYLLNVFVPTKWVSSPIIVNKFTFIKYWMVDKSYFYPLFKRLFIKFQENGLKGLWSGYSRGIARLNGLYSALPRLKDMGADMDGNLNISVKVVNWKKYYFAGAMNGVNYAKILERSKLSEPLSLESLHVIWCLFGILIAGNIILLTLEVVWSKL